MPKHRLHARQITPLVNDGRKEYNSQFKKKASPIINAQKFHVTLKGGVTASKDYDEMSSAEKAEVAINKEWHAAGVHHVYTLFTAPELGVHLVYTKALDNKC